MLRILPLTELSQRRLKRKSVYFLDNLLLLYCLRYCLVYYSGKAALIQ